jgi:hypothetical protein
MATESKSKMNLGSWMQPSVDADGNPLKKAPAKPPKMAKDTFSKDLDAWVKSQDINAKGKKGEGSPKRMSDMLRQAFKALDLEKDREGKKGLMPASEARERTDNARALNKSIQSSARSGGGGGGGGGGMNPIDLERVPGKRPLKMKKGGSVKSSASKRADGIAKKGKTRGKMV